MKSMKLQVKNELTIVKENAALHPPRFVEVDWDKSNTLTYQLSVINNVSH